MGVGRLLHWRRPAHARRRSRTRTVVFAAVLVAFVAGIGVLGQRFVDGTAPVVEVRAEAGTTSTLPTTTVTVGPGPHDPGAIARENARPGDPGWTVPDDPAVWSGIEGFADRVSAQQADVVRLFVSTAAPTFHVELYRMGWYGGAGGRLQWRSQEVAGGLQAPPTMDPVTRMAEAPWHESLRFTVGPDWVTGVYMAKLVSSDGGQSLVPVIIRDDASRAPFLIQSSVTTWQAYNGWGGASLYVGGPKKDPKLRAKVVSFDRPYTETGSSEYFGREDMLVQMVESMGLDVAYTTDVDTHEHPELLLRHRTFVSGAHDEYWSLEMRDGVEAARDAGVNLIFMGANASFRRIRLEPSPLGPNRHEVNYRVAKDDPLYHQDDARVTTSWREPPAARPESSMIGNLYECNPVDADMVIAEPSSWVFEGTGWNKGDRIPHAVGSEYDRVTPESPTPANIEVLAHSPVRCRGKPSFSDMSYYTADSGAGVLATGTFGWEPLLGPLCPDDQLASDVNCKVRKAMANVLAVFGTGPAGLQHPSTNNLAELGIKPR